MALKLNDTNITDVKFNDTSYNKVYFNGTYLYAKPLSVTITSDSRNGMVIQRQYVNGGTFAEGTESVHGGSDGYTIDARYGNQYKITIAPDSSTSTCTYAQPVVYLTTYNSGSYHVKQTITSQKYSSNNSVSPIGGGVFKLNQTIEFDNLFNGITDITFSYSSSSASKPSGYSNEASLKSYTKADGTKASKVIISAYADTQYTNIYYSFKLVNSTPSDIVTSI